MSAHWLILAIPMKAAHEACPLAA